MSRPLQARSVPLAAEEVRAGRPDRTAAKLFPVVIFLAAFLLFLLEPLAAKQLLPRFGGSAGVWISCLVFFQCALLVGYGFAHWLAGRTVSAGRLRVYPAVLLVALLLSLRWVWHTPQAGGPVVYPVAAICLELLLTVGLPFVALAATSPLLQAWSAQLDAGRMHYALFGVSNLASLLALGMYPTVVEPLLPMHAQRAVWTCGFAMFALLAGWLQVQVQRAATALPDRVGVGESGETDGHPDALVDATGLAETAVPADADAPETPWHRLLWVLLPMAASMQLAAVTAHLTSNVAAIPLLWILPLAVYLLSLIAAFQFPRLLPQWLVLRMLAVMLASLGYLLSKIDFSVPIALAVLVYLTELFFAAQFCHAAAYALRPRRPAQATLFYLLFAAGGALGSMLVGVVFPLVFSANYDLALAFTVTAAVTAMAVWMQGWSQRLLWVTATGLLLVLVGLQHLGYREQTLFSERNFYGTLRVQQNTNAHGQTIRILANGTIRHGTQIFMPGLVRTPTTYYAYDSGVGLALRFCCGGAARNVGVVGLGAGTLAAYGRPGDTFRFYDINPAVEPVARNLFTYLRQTPAEVTVMPGDARASLAAEPAQHFDVLVVDAFSGDAIPLHLLTAEAMQVYLRDLKPNGILAFHISNQHVNLEPAVGKLAGNAGLLSRTVSNAAQDNRGEFRATWVLLTRNAGFFDQPEVAAMTAPTASVPGLRLWTDDYSSLFPLLR